MRIRFTGNAVYISTILFAFICLLIIGCTSTSENRSEGSYQSVYENGNVKRDCKFLKAIGKDSYMHHCKLYHENGNLAEEGDFINDTIAVGWHTYYRVNNSIKARREFLQLPGGQIYLNRVIRFEMNGDTNKSQSNYYKIEFANDTVSAGDDLSIRFSLPAPYFQNSSVIVTLDENGLTDQLPLTAGRELHHTIKTSTKGEYELKGIIDEVEKVDQHGDTMKVQKRSLYFSVTYWVK